MTGLRGVKVSARPRQKKPAWPIHSCSLEELPIARRRAPVAPTHELPSAQAGLGVFGVILVPPTQYLFGTCGVSTGGSRMGAPGCISQLQFQKLIVARVRKRARRGVCHVDGKPRVRACRGGRDPGYAVCPAEHQDADFQSDLSRNSAGSANRRGQCSPPGLLPSPAWLLEERPGLPI